MLILLLTSLYLAKLTHLSLVPNRYSWRRRGVFFLSIVHYVIPPGNDPHGTLDSGRKSF